MTELVRQSLRMRPDRVVIGEVRGPEISDLLMALNTSHEGGCGTVHENSPAMCPLGWKHWARLVGWDGSAARSIGGGFGHRGSHHRVSRTVGVAQRNLCPEKGIKRAG